MDADEDVGALMVLAAKAATAGVDGLDGDGLICRVRLLEMVRRAVDAATAHVVSELDAKNIPDERFGFRTGTWLAVDGHLPSVTGRQRVKVARLLRICVILDDALAAGRLSFEHIRVVAEATNARNILAVVDLQDRLIELTGEFVRFEAWAANVRGLLSEADPDGGHDPRPEDNRLHLSRGLDGEVQGQGLWVGEWGETVIDTLNRMADNLFERFVRDQAEAPGDVVIPTRSALLALAFAECCRIAAGKAGTVPVPAADITLIVHADDPEVVTTVDGHRVGAHTAAVARCDGVFHRLTVNSAGVPLDLARAARFANRDQRRAVHRRDRGCVFPGCDAPVRWTDVHHVIFWEDDGPTDLDNLACLCRHHHGVIHRTNWSMRTIDDQWFEITTPSGTVLVSQRNGQPHHAP